MKGGRRKEGNDRENTATLTSAWPDEKVISEPTFVGMALHFGNPGHGGRGGKRFVSLDLLCTEIPTPEWSLRKRVPDTGAAFCVPGCGR